MKHGHRLAVALVLLFLCLGVGIWAGYLSSRSLDDADRLSSVLGGFASAVFGVAGVIIGLLGLRRGRNAEPAAPEDSRHAAVGDRSVVVGRLQGTVITGDHARVSGLSTQAVWVLGLVVALAAAASVTSVVLALRGGPEPAGVATGAYTVTMSGSAIGGDPFELRGELRIRPATDGQPYEWCMKVGNPWGAPKPGAVWFGTNGTCFGNGADSAAATMREVDGEHVLTPVTPPPALDDSMNAFTATSGVSAGAYVPDGGTVRFRPQPSRLEGSLSLLGLAVSGGSTRGTVTATFSATRTSDDPEAIVDRPSDPVFGSDAPAPPPDLPGVRYTVRTITSFVETAGNPEFTDRARARFAAAVFVIDERDGGSFRYDVPDSRRDLFPVTGTVTGTAPMFVLSGSRTSGAGDTAASTEIGGTLDLSGSTPFIRLTLRSTTANGTSSGYEVEAVLQ